MSTQNAFPARNATPANNGGTVVRRPGVVQTIGGALNQAFGACGTTPDDLTHLLRRLDKETSHFDGE